MGDITDITPPRLSAIDVASLTDVEVRAILLNVAGHPDPVVAAAVTESTRFILERTRSPQADT
jgi:hypothetical protein